jgi:adenosine deaminase
MASLRRSLEQAVDAADLEALRRIPKTDLHCHGLLSAPRQAYERLFGDRIPAPPARFADFSDFGAYIAANLLPALTGPQAVRAIVRAALERAADEGVVYTEMSFDLFLPDFVPGLTLEGFAALVGEEGERVAARLRVAPEIGIDRTMPVDEILSRLKRAVASGVWCSIDLYSDERIGAIRDFVPIFDLAADRGLKRKAHAGELCGAASVRDAVELLQLDAVQHGVRAVEDPAVAEFLAERRVPLHMCPTSNRNLGICDSFETHPARRLFDSGVSFTVNTDDFTLFGTSVCDELLNLKTMGFTSAEIARIVGRGLDEAGRFAAPPDTI